MAASNLLYSCLVLADQDMSCREENFIVFMYVLRSIVTPWSGLPNSRDQNHVHVYFFIFPWLALYVALVYLIHRWTMLEKMRKTLSGNSDRHKGFRQCLRMRKAGSCKPQILETRVDFFETRSELFQKQAR